MTRTMDLHNTLLERMASISSEVRNHLGSKSWLLQIDEDEINPQTLVLDCMSLMIDEIYDFGVEFYCTREELCENLYILDKVLLLFEVIYPTPLYRSFTEDTGFKRWLISTVIDGAGDPNNTTILNLLNYLANENEATIDLFTDTYNFLHDKVLSTPIFDIYIANILTTDNTPYEPIVDKEEITEYLGYVQTTITKLLHAIDILNSINPDSEIQYTNIGIYKNNKTILDKLPINTWIYQTNKSTNTLTPIEQSLLVRYTREFKSITPIYEDYYRVRSLPLTRNDVISIIIGCFEQTTTRDAFTSLVDTSFQRLTDLLPATDTGLHVFIQTVTLTLVKEFYS